MDPLILSTELLAAAREVTLANSPGVALAGVLRRLAGLLPGCALTVLSQEGDGDLRVAAQEGLRPEVLGRCFAPSEHPRLLRALQGRGPVRFHDPRQPDPYQDWLPGGVPRIHACMAAPLPSGGLLTFDAQNPGGLDLLGDEQALLWAALAGVAAQIQRAAPGAEPPAGRPLWGTSPVMARLQREVALLGPLPTTVLIVGETGVGKELVARALHQASARAARPLVQVNCAALAPDLLESELFGHARGAFTGAVSARRGKFGAADGGTLYLDEVGELPPAAQAALLRALQEGEVARVGEDLPRRVDVRVLLATHRDLPAEVAAGRFRADLYHRIAVYPLRVPPLRERAADIPALCQHLTARVLLRYPAELARARVHWDEAALARLCAHPWPGNVRELGNLVERALLRALLDPRRGAALHIRAEHIDLIDLAGAPPALAAPQPLSALTEGVRREALSRALRDAGGNAAQAARSLGISRAHAYKEAVRLGLLPGPRGKLGSRG